ncbi:MAG: Methyltransferase type 11 [Pseudonocardiales bacterium]|nr:Methyltransferase type 11 [Pseudonocardiales bacterium]
MTSHSVEDLTEPGEGVYRRGYFSTRFADDPNRTRVWQHICRHLGRWIGPNDSVLDLGAGRCDFANNVVAASVTALDADDTVLSSAGPGVKAIVGDCSDLSAFQDDSLDVVLASNLLEHLDRATTLRLLGEARRVLKSGGRLILLQPNFRLKPGAYFDDYTHVAIFTDRSLRDLLTAEGWTVTHVARRFLPLSMNSRGSRLTFLVPWYLRSPIKPLAGQMLLIAVA